MQQTAMFMASLVGDVSISQIIGWTTTLGGGLFAFWKFVLQRRLDVLRQTDETWFRYREFEEGRRATLQAEMMEMIRSIKDENEALRTKLLSSEDERMRLMNQIGELQIEISNLRAQVVTLTMEITRLRGDLPHAHHG